MAETVRIDKAGQLMAESVDNFGAAVMINLLAELPKSWREHLQKVTDAINSLDKDLEQSDRDYLSRVIADEQLIMTKSLCNIVSKCVGEEGSACVKVAAAWVAKASKIFSGEIASGLDSKKAFSNTIRVCGFPKIYSS